MPFEIVRNDIVNMSVDAIVNTANPDPVIGSGVDSAIHKAAGPGLLKAREQAGRLAAGEAAITPAFMLHSRYVIHTVGPVWIDGRHNEEALLASCYKKSLELAKQHHCGSIAFPLISTGNYGFPKDKALQIAIREFSAFLMENDMQIFLVVFGHQAFALSEKLVRSVASYIDENYIQEKNAQEYGEETALFKRRAERRLGHAPAPSLPMPEFVANACCPMADSAFDEEELYSLLAKVDAGFTDTLLDLIDQSGKKDSEIYRKALLTKQHFSKIRNNPNYKPTKSTALALALALELDLDAANDLIGRAGYALTNSSKFDLIIRYCIEHRKYNIVEINIMLYEFDQPLLGSA